MKAKRITKGDMEKGNKATPVVRKHPPKVNTHKGHGHKGKS